VFDQERDSRHPVDPGSLGDGARVFARELRLRLWREHLGLEPDGSDAQLVDPVEARWAAVLYRVAIDPDGRPLPLRGDTSL
jgi:hypothetical protein